MHFHVRSSLLPWMTLEWQLPSTSGFLAQKMCLTSPWANHLIPCSWYTKKIGTIFSRERNIKLENIARIASAVPCRSLLKGHYECWECVLKYQKCNQCINGLSDLSGATSELGIRVGLKKQNLTNRLGLSKFYCLWVYFCYKHRKNCECCPVSQLIVR